jgi:Na+/H+ antiporter NhaD/arsenite permease-like protein
VSNLLEQFMTKAINVCIRTDFIVLFPFHVPIYIPRQLLSATLDTLSALRVISPRQTSNRNDSVQPFVRLNFPLNFITAPLIADLFLLAILAIGREEVQDGTLGADNIYPIDIMAFFLSLAYIAISIDASGLIRFLAFKVLQKGGKVGHKLFFYLYVFFFGLGSFIGNDPIILSGTAFLAYMTRVSSNIIHPRAWIHTQFAVANIASAILVSSNPTNLVLANAFDIKFITYTANMIVPVVVTAVVLFPFLLYIVFADKSLIPISIKMHELSEEAKAKRPVNPNIPHARGNAEEQENDVGNDQDSKLLSLEEIMNPFVDKGGAVFGAVIMTATLVTLLALNAASQRGDEHPVFWVTLPAAFVMFCWDVAFGWYHRHETRDIARKGLMEVENARAERERKEKEEVKQTILERDERDAMSEPYASVLARTHSQESQLQRQSTTAHPTNAIASDKECTLDEDKSRSTPPLTTPLPSENGDGGALMLTTPLESSISTLLPRDDPSRNFPLPTTAVSKLDEKQELSHTAVKDSPPSTPPAGMESGGEMAGAKQRRPTLVSLINDGYTWLQETFPTVTAVVAHLPFALVPFTFCMFILVQGLVTKG